MNDLADRAAETLKTLRERTPLVHNITNYVVMNYTANALLAMGASPVMAHAAEEVEEMAAMAGALVLNIGTLSGPWIEAMEAAGKAASRRGVPVVLDPVGAGATAFRTRTAKRLLAECRPRVVRGNPSEILALRDEGARTRGVDSLHGTEAAIEAAAELAAEGGCAIAVTGPVDLVTDGRRTLRVANGHPLMGKVTGTGCTATVTVAAFLAVEPDPVLSAAAGLAFFGLAGEKAAEKQHAPGSFMIALLDALYTLTPDDLARGARISPA